MCNQVSLGNRASLRSSQKKFKIFSLPARNTTLKHDLDSLYIAFAILNLFHKPILSNVMHEDIAQTLKSRLNVPKMGKKPVFLPSLFHFP